MKQIKAVLAGATAVAALGGLALSSSASAAQPQSAPSRTVASKAVVQPGSEQAVAQKSSPATSESRVLGVGVMDGHRWSAALVYYPKTPAGYAPGHNPKELLCIAVTMDGKPTNPYGEECMSVTGPHDPSGDLGDYGQDYYAGGSSLFFGQPLAHVASATMTFGNARSITVPKVTIPGTDFSAYVIPVAAHLQMKNLYEYDSQHHLVSQQKL